MRAAPKKFDCLICQAPELIRKVVNNAIWPDNGIVRSANYRAAGARAASQAAMTMADADRWSELDPKTITRHADHTEESWREIEPGEPLREGEVVVSIEFGSVTDAYAQLGMETVEALGQVVRANPLAFAALRTKEAISIAKLGLAAASAKETSRLKGRRQNIDLVAIFTSSAGHLPVDPHQAAEDAESVDDMRAHVAAERLALTAGQ